MSKCILWMGLILVWFPGYPCIHIYNNYHQQVSSDFWNRSPPQQQPQPPQINSEISNNWPFQHQQRTRISTSASSTSSAAAATTKTKSPSSLYSSSSRSSPSELHDDVDDESVVDSTFNVVSDNNVSLRHNQHNINNNKVSESDITRRKKKLFQSAAVSSSNNKVLNNKNSNKNNNKNPVEIKQSTRGAATAADQQSQMNRQPRGSRQYDVPQIECPPVEDGVERFSCPTPDRMGRYRCIDDHVLCDGFIDCPNAEDEDRLACMFYKTTKIHLDVLADALLRWARGR